ncbi:MAG: YhgE/Pip domain-containing protein, partial [Tomitella sp.]|nr:YhgE/Pip domain-containing protein [Tomitella sp.]
MREAWRVFTRDVMRLVRVRKAWIILLGIVITPSLYAWFNIAAFWDPYTNTQNIDVAVVNLDEGASSVLAGKLDVGDEVVDQLKENDELGWRFLDEDEAMESVESGESYAAIIIPENFSQGFASFTTGSLTKPSLQYYVNEKASAVAPKITDVGASTLDTQIGSTFISTVAETVTDKLKDVGADAEGELRGVHSDTIGALDRTLDTVSSGRARIGDLLGSLSEAQDRLRGAQGTIDKADGTFGDVQSALAQAQSIVEEAQQELVTITGSVTDAYVSGTTLLGDATSRLNTTVSRISAGADRAGIGATSAIDTAEALLGAGDRALTDIESFLNSPGGGSAASQQLGSAVTGLQERTGADRTLLDQLRQLSTGIGGVTDQVEQAFATFDAGAGDASSSADALRDSLRQVVPALNGSISSLSSSAGGFSSAQGAQRAQQAQAKKLVEGVGANHGP